MDLKANCTIHNNFEIEVRDAKTGKVKQKETAYNIVLDQMWTRLCSGLTYFTHIYFGTGSGTPTPSRSSLFTSLGNRAASNEEIKREVPISTWKRKIVLNPEEYVGQKITEVGIGFDGFTSNLVTHAMLKDSEGNPISILKTDTDVITIFATVYVTLTSNYENVSFVGIHNNTNSLINYLVGGSSFPNGSFGLNEIQAPYERLGSSSTASWTADTVSRQRKARTMRFGITNGNGYAGYLDFSNLFALKLQQPGVFSGQPYTDVQVGVGDGHCKEWTLPSYNVKQSTVDIKVDGIIRSNVVTKEYYAYPIRMDERYFGFFSSPYGIVISSNNKMMAVAHKFSPYISTYDKTDGAWVKRASPEILPTGFGRSVAFSKDNKVMALAHSNSPYISTYDWKEGLWIKRPDPETLPTGDGYDVSLTSDGNVMSVVHSNSPNVTTYDWIEESWVARVAPPNALLSSNCKIAMSSNGNVLAVSGSVAPYIFTYDWFEGAWIKRPDPVSLPSSTGTGIALSHDGNVMITGEYYSPYIVTYDWISGDWVRRPNPINLPVARANAIAANPDCTVLALCHPTSPYLSVYDWRENTWVKRIDPKSILGKYAGGIAISDDGIFVGLTHSDAQSIATYEFIKNTVVNFDVPPAVGQIITADYTVDGVHKTDQYVIDVSFAIQFGEGVSIQ